MECISSFNLSIGDLICIIINDARVGEVRVPSVLTKKVSKHGIFPFQKPIGLVEKRIFSSSANPYMHTFFGIIGCLYKDGRFNNSINVAPSLAETCLMDALAFKASSQSGEYRQYFYTSCEMRDDAGPDTHIDETHRGMKIAAEMVQILNDFTDPKAYMATFRLAPHAKTRKGTLGHAYLTLVTEAKGTIMKHWMRS